MNWKKKAVLYANIGTVSLMKNTWSIFALCFALLAGFILFKESPRWMEALASIGGKKLPAQPESHWLTEHEFQETEDIEEKLRRLLALRNQLRVPWALADEAILRFSSLEAMNAFLRNSGKLSVLGSNPSLKAVRVGFDNYQDLLDDSGNAQVAPNYLVQLPPPPDPESPGIQAGAVGFGASALDWLGVPRDHSEWGSGTKVAVIDTGVQTHSTFGDTSISEIDVLANATVEDGGDGTVTIHGHGTAVASIISGQDSVAPGVAPAAEVISVRVANEEGLSDSFTLAEGIMAAADARADVINISMGSAGNSSIVSDAVVYAQDKGSLLIAAAGNNGVDSLAYPAGYEGVISVGSVDAEGQHLAFSNAGDQLNLSAPGLEVNAAWPDEQVIQFSGTSASTPFVAGSVAAIMSLDPDLSSQQAYNLLVDYSNEAGAPGHDAYYGSGTLNVDRVINRDQPGIYDLAVASHYEAGQIDNNGLEVIQVVVENRGTETINTSQLNLDWGYGNRDFILPSLDPGEVIYRQQPIDSRRADIDGSIQYTSNLTMPVNLTDQNTANNGYQSVYVSPAARAAAEQAAAETAATAP
ncbi:MAG: S8 family serine peptidase [Verrucomicrobiota bacterium]